MAPAEQVDPDEVRSFALDVWRHKQGEMVALMIHLGDRLGLYEALSGTGPVTAAELAATTGLHERWLLEWLRSQAAADLLTYEEGDRFELVPAAAEVLVNENSLFFVAGVFDGPRPTEVVDKLADAFRTGIGLTYDELGPRGAHSVERMLGPWARHLLVPAIVPALDGVVDKLEAGATAVDVGCGAGLVLQLLAEAFPQSTFHGYDPSTHALAMAREKFAARGLSNVEVFEAGAEDLPEDPTYDLALTFDCLHDMTRPDVALAAIRRSIHSDGTLVIKDIRSTPDFEKNRKNPLLALMYSTSVATCMSSAMSAPDGMGLGTLGLNPQVAEQMTTDAGFSRFRQHDFDDPANLYYEVRP